MLDHLKGLRVVDATTIVMGPMATQILGDLGAEVIKLETPQGDLARASGSAGPGGMGALFANNNRNKISLALDLKQPGAQEVLARLLASADVVVHNMRPAAAEKLGLGYAAARAANPAVVHCAATGFGSGGPYAGRAAYDDVIQAASGLAGLAVETAGAPAFVPSIMADKIAALHVVYAILAALLRRQATGEGASIEVPMFEVMAAFLMNEHLDAASFDAEGAPGYGRLLTPHRKPHRTADGWLAVMPYDAGHWRRTLAIVGAGHVAEEPWFADPAERNRRSADLYALIGAALPSQPTAHWVAAFADADVPHAQVAGLGDLLSDPHLAAQGFFTPTDGLPGRVRSVPQPVRFSGAAATPDRPPPGLNGGGEALLRGLGISPEEIARLIG
ncbi:MAG: CoA transferase [Rhodobacteraceae bacterium]|nr:CoA transferase [Paracoccaceae bacterium]